MNFDESEVLKAVKTNLNGPFIRNMYLRRNQDEFNAGNILNSVFYQTEALCLGFRCKYPEYNPNHLETNKYSYPISRNDIKHCSKIVKFAEMKTRSTMSNVPNDIQHFETDPKKGIESIQEFCKLLPKEWTLLQLSKNFNPETNISFKSEIITREDSIFLTILKNAQHDLYSDPICLNIDMSGCSGYIFKKFCQISNDLKSRSKVLGKDTKEDRAKYWKNMNEMNENIRDAVGELQTLIGPWKCFFSGPVLPSYKKYESEIFEDVKKFCADNDLNTRQYIILSSLACKATSLTENDISLACSELTIDDGLAKRIRKYLISVRSKSTERLEYSPCLIIVDEVLDHFFWEMLNPQQEFCRLSSFSMLKSLYYKYQDKISNGYVKLCIENGKWIVNPDKTLNNMEKRISKFISYWIPHFECVFGQIPTNDDMIKYLTKSDLFLYSGHGSGLQFINGHKIAKLKSDAVVILLGCDSTRLHSDGLHSEMCGPHLYYFATLCPALIGSILIAFDRQLDNITARILSTWIPSKQKFQWNKVHMELWTQDCKNMVVKNLGSSAKHIYEPRLPLIIARERNNCCGQLYGSVGLVYRGLPVWNTNAE